MLADDSACVRCLFGQLVLCALGRSLTEADAAWVEKAVAAAGREPTLAGLIEELVESAEFRQR